MSNARTGDKKTEIKNMTDTASVLKKKPLTAKEMKALSPSLSSDGTVAMLATGEMYVWDARCEHWARWK